MNIGKVGNLFELSSWKWILVSYCFLILYHLVPTYVILSPLLLSANRDFFELVVWVGIGVAGVSAFVGFRSQRPRILEPALAAALYCLTITVFLRAPENFPTYYRQARFVAAMSIIAFVVAFASAGITTLLRMRKEVKATT